MLRLHCDSDVIVAVGGRRQNPRQDVVDDRRDARPLPVLAVDVQADRDVAAVLRLPHRQDFVGGGRLRVAEEGRAKQLERSSGERLEQPLRGIELEQGLGLADGREIGVGIGVAADLMPFADHALEQAALGQRIFADDEEGRRNLLGFQDVEDLRGPARRPGHRRKSERSGRADSRSE